MIKVITYGTYDLLHYGHIRLLKRAKALGDYLIVGVTADVFDRSRGKINVQQSLMERVEAVRATGIADEIIIEEYEGQKIDDIKRLRVDIFTVGSDWKGSFDYLNEYCRVVYLDRTQGISSTELRSERQDLRIGLVGESGILNKFECESHFVNGVNICGICSNDISQLLETTSRIGYITNNYSELLEKCDAVYIASHPSKHYEQIKEAILRGKHVLCECPIALKVAEWEDLMVMAKRKNVVVMDSLKTAYATAYYRLLLLVKSGKIGNVVAIDSICTSMRDLVFMKNKDLANTWNSFTTWGPTALLPVFQILGTGYIDRIMVSHMMENSQNFDLFTQVSFLYPNAVASIKVGKGVKSEGNLVISGTKGYVYVPAPWWKTDYFELRFEDPLDNRRYFYQLDGEGIRYAIVNFIRSIRSGTENVYVDRNMSKAFVREMEYFSTGNQIKI